MKKRKRVLFVFCMVCTIFFTSISVQAKSKSASKNFVFVDSDFITCTVKVTANLSQTFTRSGSNSIYKKRTACVFMDYTSPSTIPRLSTSTPRYVNSDNKTVKTFSPWLKNTGGSIFPSGTDAVAYDHYNTTSVTYKNNNVYYYFVNYTVGNSNFINPATRAGNCKMALATTH